MGYDNIILIMQVGIPHNQSFTCLYSNKPQSPHSLRTLAIRTLLSQRPFPTLSDIDQQTLDQANICHACRYSAVHNSPLEEITCDDLFTGVLEETSVYNLRTCDVAKPHHFVRYLCLFFAAFHPATHSRYGVYAVFCKGNHSGVVRGDGNDLELNADGVKKVLEKWDGMEKGSFENDFDAEACERTSKFIEAYRAELLLGVAFHVDLSHWRPNSR